MTSNDTEFGFERFRFKNSNLYKYHVIINYNLVIFLNLSQNLYKLETQAEIDLFRTYESLLYDQICLKKADEILTLKSDFFKKNINCFKLATQILKISNESATTTDLVRDLINETP